MPAPFATLLAAPTLAALLLAAPPAPPVECPAGTALRGAAPPDDVEAWCEGRPDAFGRPRRHGPSRTWYEDGTLRTEEHWHEGKRDGRFVEYHRNGRKAREGTYRLDDKVGTWTIWFEDGALEERSEWVANVPHGRAATWHRGGARRSEGRYCMGAQCGTWTTWDERGREQGRVEFGVMSTQP